MTTKPDPDALADEPEGLEEVLADVAELLRGYEAHHRKRTHDATTVNAAVDSSLKAERNCAMAWRVEQQLAALRAHSPEAGRVGEADAELIERLREMRSEYGLICCGEAATRIAALTPSEPVSPAREEVERQHVMPGDPEGLGGIALRWYTGFRWGEPHSLRESNIAVEGFKDGYRACLSALQPQQQERADG